MIVLFADVADPAAASQHIKLLDRSGAGAWQHGGSRKVLVRKNLDPGPYLVMIEPGIGVRLHGAVFVERG